MESARSYRQEPLSEEQLETARLRAKHVIVLMLENRSFDHMFGLLDHPHLHLTDVAIGDHPDARFTNVGIGDHPNPYDLTDPTKFEPVSASGEPRLEVDPPHGHVAAMTQLNLRGKTFQMDGFVAAYAQKIAGKEHVPKPRWGRLGILTAVLSLPIAAALHDFARRGVNGGWSGFPVWAAGAAAVVGVIILALRLPLLPGMRRRYLAAAWLGLALLGAFAAAGLDRWWSSGEPRGRITWSLVVLALLMAGLVLVRKKLSTELSIPDESVRAMSRRIMACMPPSHIPALAQLARDYAVCTRWHSSVPGATWPNRNFAHSATSDESVDIELGFYGDRTIFQTLDDVETAPKPTWRIYHHDTPQVFAFNELWQGGKRRRWFDAGRLLRDIADDKLPSYSFVEPCHTGAKANSQHPGNNEEIAAGDFVRGEQLIASIYNALVAKPEVFEETVFVVTYDEHGGFFDHVAPPRAVHPELPGRRRRSREIGRRIVSKFIEYDNRPFPFTHLGVRVPTVVVSPWVGHHKVDATVYDHASIVATVRRLWAPAADPLSERDRHANDFLHLLVAHDQPMGQRDTDEPGDAPRRCPHYDADPAGLDDAVGTATDDIEMDVAALGRATREVYLKDDFSAQLGQLNHLVRDELRTSPGDDVLVSANPAERLPTAVLFKDSADGTRNGNAVDE